MTIETITLIAALVPLIIAGAGFFVKMHRQIGRLRADVDAAEHKFAPRDAFKEMQSDVQAHGLALTRHEAVISGAKRDIWEQIKSDEKTLAQHTVDLAKILERMKK